MIVSYTPAIGSSSTVIALRKRRAEGSDGAAVMERAQERERARRRRRRTHSAFTHQSWNI